jgi:hypothetical protein
VLAADVLYERASVALLGSLLPLLGAVTWLADPGRPAAGAFLEQACRHWSISTAARGGMQVHRLRARSHEAAPEARPRAVAALAG